MALKYILDTNIYIDAIREPEDAPGVFLERNTPMTFMSAVVVQELRAGAVTDAQSRALQEGIFGAFEHRNRRPRLAGDASDRCRPGRADCGFRTRIPAPRALRPKSPSMPFRDPRGEPRSSMPRDWTGRSRDSGRRIRAKLDSRNRASRRALAKLGKRGSPPDQRTFPRLSHRINVLIPISGPNISLHILKVGRAMGIEPTGII
jgi:hypothetical protein